MLNAGMDDIEIPAFLRKQTDDGVPVPVQSSHQAPPPKSPAKSTPVTVKAPTSARVPTPVPLTPAQLQSQKEKAYADQLKQLSNLLSTLQDPANPLAELVQKFNAQAYGNRNFRAALSTTLSTTRTAFLADFVMRFAKALGSPAMVWAVLMVWLADEKGLVLERHARRLIDAELGRLDRAAREELVESLRGSVVNQV